MAEYQGVISYVNPQTIRAPLLILPMRSQLKTRDR
jgi:hypothetical protein